MACTEAQQLETSGEQEIEYEPINMSLQACKARYAQSAHIWAATSKAWQPLQKQAQEGAINKAEAAESQQQPKETAAEEKEGNTQQP